MKYTSIMLAAAVAGISMFGAPRETYGQSAPATADTAVHVTFGAFVDGYYAWDFGRPSTMDRSFAGGSLFTTQPARHNEFNINLAFIEATLSGARVRGRLALQAGTSVQSNYSGEATNGQVSGATLARAIQEAFAGVKLGDGLWIDGGIFFSHMGMESWISRDNLTYTRSLVAEYSPYYSSGVRLVWTATPRLTAHVHVVNGWQNISENNTGKGAGIRLDYAATPSAAISYYNFFTDETGNRLRMFHGIGTKAVVGALTVLGQADVGTQSRSSATGSTAHWYGFTVIGRVAVTSKVAVVGRVERYDDPEQVIMATGTRPDAVANGPFQGDGGSFGLDVAPQPRVLWRTEARGMINRTPIFPDGVTGAPTKRNMLLVSSLSMTF